MNNIENKWNVFINTLSEEETESMMSILFPSKEPALHETRYSPYKYQTEKNKFFILDPRRLSNNEIENLKQKYAIFSL